MRQEQNRKGIESFMLVFAIVAASLAIMLPLTAPEVSAQVFHLGSTSAEDAAGAPYDTSPSGDNLVYWDINEDHIMNIDYVVEPGYELRIPALNDLAPNVITVTMPISITVMDGARLTFENDGPFTRTKFVYTGSDFWGGIYFATGSEGLIQDVEINGASTALTFSPGSTILGAGITLTRVQDFELYGMYIDGAVGSTNIHGSIDVFDTLHSGTGMYLANGDYTLTDVIFAGHGYYEANLYVCNAYVNAYNCYFNCENEMGHALVVESSPAPDSTVVMNPIFDHGAPGKYYVKGDGGTALIINGKFNEANNASAVMANSNGATGQHSHIIVLNGTALSGSPFNSTRVSVSPPGGSTVTIQWYVDVFADDPDGNAIPSATVDLEDPSWPDTMLTETTGPEKGWARNFVVTEKVVNFGYIDYYNPLNASAENNTMFGFAEPEPDILSYTAVFITVPFNPVPNTLPTATIITTLSGTYTGLISIDFSVFDPDPGDDGFLKVDVLYWDDATGWVKAEADVSSDPITGLSSGVTYTFVWDSRDPNNLQNRYSSNVQIRIVPHDKLGIGTLNLSGIFTVDNKWPVVLTGPTAIPSDNGCVIQWTLNEAATSEVLYGLYGDGTVNDLTTQVETLALNTTPVLSLSGLLPGRRYTYVITSTDAVGNKYSSAPATFFFETTLSIQLYKGWNMISIPHLLLDWPLHLVLATIEGDWDIAMSYDAMDTSDPWKTNYTGKPYHLNDLHEYHINMALWLHVTTDTVLTPNYMFDAMLSIYPDFPLEKGWNFVGYYSVTPRNIDDALSSIAGSYDKVEHYDASTGLWLIYNGISGPLTTMEPTKGYWIHTTEAVVWSMPYE